MYDMRGTVYDQAQVEKNRAVNALLKAIGGEIPFTHSTDETVDRIYAAGATHDHSDVVDLLIYVIVADDWYVRAGQEPDWGIGLRLDFSYVRRFLIYSLRRQTVDEPLFISADVLDLYKPPAQLWLEVAPAEARFTVLTRQTEDDIEPVITDCSNEFEAITAARQQLRTLVNRLKPQ